jgi:(p)ppGpp synthase/HD superfamily hydrolase
MATSANLIVTAAHFAAVKHRNQRRKDKDKTPYINHPLDVANILSASNITDPVVLISAILHDTVEDTQTTFSELEVHFGLEIANVVREVTDDKSLKKVERKRLQIEHAKDISDKAKLVKMADKYSNLTNIDINPPTFWSKEILEGYIVWNYAVCRNLRGINNTIEEQLDAIFAQFGITDDISDTELNTRLETYYSVINQQE